MAPNDHNGYYEMITPVRLSHPDFRRKDAPFFAGDLPRQMTT